MDFISYLFYILLYFSVQQGINNLSSLHADSMAREYLLLTQYLTPTIFHQK